MISLGALGALAAGVAAAVVLTPRRRPDGSAGWVELEGARVRLERGRGYRGCVSVPFFVPTALVESKLPGALREKGFSDVVVARDTSPGWPAVDCDLYVEATWNGDDGATFDRPGAVKHAWVAV